MVGRFFSGLGGTGLFRSDGAESGVSLYIFVLLRGDIPCWIRFIGPVGPLRVPFLGGAL